MCSASMKPLAAIFWKTTCYLIGNCSLFYLEKLLRSHQHGCRKKSRVFQCFKRAKNSLKQRGESISLTFHPKIFAILTLKLL